MISVLVSGEGPTDMGEPTYPDIEPANFKKGPMVGFVEEIIRQQCNGEMPKIELISRSRLSEIAKKDKRLLTSIHQIIKEPLA